MKKQQRYTPEFRAEAVKLVTEQSCPRREQQSGWRFLRGLWRTGMATSKASQHPGHVLRRIWRPRMPGCVRSWLRPAWSVTKAIAYFAKESLPGTRS
ncbi:hypothetical protein ANRL1_04004 [Anaerolineae bacterium]|nr:hypothetical protein ANRL1_04004 [Anaerolineae bacterium]